jgi:hypothetical protein
LVTSIMRRFALFVLLLAAGPGGSPAWGESADVGAEIARLRARLAAGAAQEQHCLSGATRPIWTASVASDLKMLQSRASQAAAEGADAQAQRWRELAQKAAALEARAAASARSGAELTRSQQVGLDCLDRFAPENEALRASLEVALTDPAVYRESLDEARRNGTERLRQDLARVQERSRALSAEWKVTRAEAQAEAPALKAELVDLRRRNTVALESEPARLMADPTLRAAESLIAAAEAWAREQAAAARLAGSSDETERRKTARDREEAARHALDYWAAADRLLARLPLQTAP